MQTPLTYTFVEWYALLAQLGRPGVPELTESDLPMRITNTVGRSWLMGQRVATVDLHETDAAVLIALRAELPDAEVLSAIAEADRIVREHQRRHASR